MGIACGDLDGDGRVDLAVTNFFGESTTFFHNLGGGFFADHSDGIGLTAATRHLLGFGIAFLDVDNDGRLDLLSANGHVNDGRPRFPYAMPLQLLSGGPGGPPDATSRPRPAPPFTTQRLGRGLAAGDLDNDGRIDAVVVAQNEPLIFLHNTTRAAGHFIRFRLEGTPLQPRRHRRPGHDHREQPPPDRPADRRGKLPVGERPAAALRSGQGRSSHRDRGSLAVGPGRPAPRLSSRSRVRAPGAVKTPSASQG